MIQNIDIIFDIKKELQTLNKLKTQEIDELKRANELKLIELFLEYGANDVSSVTSMVVNAGD